MRLSGVCLMIRGNIRYINNIMTIIRTRHGHFHRRHHYLLIFIESIRRAAQQ